MVAQSRSHSATLFSEIYAQPFSAGSLMIAQAGALRLFVNDPHCSSVARS